MNYLDILGYSIIFLVLIFLLPRVIKRLNSKSLDKKYARKWKVFTVGMVLWIIYATIYMHNGPYLWVNTIAFVTMMSIVYIELKYNN